MWLDRSELRWMVGGALVAALVGGLSWPQSRPEVGALPPGLPGCLPLDTGGYDVLADTGWWFVSTEERR